MKKLPLVYAPNPIFKQKANAVTKVNELTRQTIDAMFITLEKENGLGLGANMVGLLERIIITHMREGTIAKPHAYINPEITWQSDQLHEFDEASLSYPGISAKIKRPKAISLKYIDYDGNNQTIEAEGFFATVLQHEIDYLDGIVFLDYLSKTKRDMLLKKMKKYQKNLTH